MNFFVKEFESSARICIMNNATEDNMTCQILSFVFRILLSDKTKLEMK